MSKAKPVSLGEKYFLRQKDALAHFSEMLSRYQVDEIVNDLDSIDLLELLRRHPHFDSKVGSGIGRFRAIISPDGSKCFGIERINGSIVDFSFIRCITRIW